MLQVTTVARHGAQPAQGLRAPVLQAHQRPREAIPATTQETQTPPDTMVEPRVAPRVQTRQRLLVAILATTLGTTTLLATMVELHALAQQAHQTPPTAMTVIILVITMLQGTTEAVLEVHQALEVQHL